MIFDVWKLETLYRVLSFMARASSSWRWDSSTTNTGEDQSVVVSAILGKHTSRLPTLLSPQSIEAQPLPNVAA